MPRVWSPRRSSRLSRLVGDCCERELWREQERLEVGVGQGPSTPLMRMRMRKQMRMVV